jgi:hypothetical protein
LFCWDTALGVTIKDRTCGCTMSRTYRWAVMLPCTRTCWLLPWCCHHRGEVPCLHSFAVAFSNPSVHSPPPVMALKEANGLIGKPYVSPVAPLVQCRCWLAHRSLAWWWRLVSTVPRRQHTACFGRSMGSRDYLDSWWGREETIKEMSEPFESMLGSDAVSSCPRGIGRGPCPLEAGSLLGETFKTRVTLVWVWPACNRPRAFSRFSGLRRGMLVSCRALFPLAESIQYQ